MGSLTVFILAFSCFCIGFSTSEKIVNAWRNIKLDDPEIILYANRALRRINSNQTEDATQYKILQILEAKMQVVSGKNFLIIFRIGLTDCPKNTKCPDDAKILSTKDYRTLIYSQPWNNIENYAFTEQQQQDYTNNLSVLQKECPSLMLTLFALFAITMIRLDY
ncbi:hypothetical protein M3Y97_00533700 [Aphelenchoides bicaudatus]|nr:hypothetical protein M3Y97_00533700 [Aphelenchoides bicaudatus]